MLMKALHLKLGGYEFAATIEATNTRRYSSKAKKL